MRTEEAFKDHVSSELRKSDARMDELTNTVAAIQLEQVEAKILLAKNTETINKVEANTQELIEVFNSWKGAMRVIDMIGKLAKPIGYIALAISSILGLYVAVKTGMGIK